jgi:hypothetical protein
LAVSVGSNTGWFYNPATYRFECLDRRGEVEAFFSLEAVFELNKHGYDMSFFKFMMRRAT